MNARKLPSSNPFPMSSKQLITFETLADGHPCFLDAESTPNWPELFGNNQPIKLEIGFGNGNFLLEMSIREPESNFVGMDFYHKGIRKVITRIDKLALKNIRIAYGDARERLPFLFESCELSGIYINFPDPWPKKRHIKRRLIKPAFVKILAGKLITGKEIHLATDSESYAKEMLDYLEAEPNLKNSIGEMEFLYNRENTPKTKYEKYFINAGEKIYYLNFVKI